LVRICNFSVYHYETANIELLSIENLYLNLFDIFILLHEAGGQKAIVEEQAEEYVALIMEDHQGT